MSVIDKILDSLKLSPDDDYEYDNEEFDMDEEPEEKKKPSRKERRKSEETDPVREKPAKNVSKITPISKKDRKQGAGMEVCVIKPTTISDEIEITDTLLSGRTVIINMEGLDVDLAQRIIDFTSGSAYAMRGRLQKISNYIFLVTPAGVDISGDISNLIESYDSDSLSL